MRKFKTGLLKNYNRYGYLFIMPWIIGFIVFLAYPLLASFLFSFMKIEGLTNIFQNPLIGLSNYIHAFIIDANYIPAFFESISKVLVNTPAACVFSLIIAILINKKVKFKSFFRLVVFIPVLLGSGAVMQLLMGAPIDHSQDTWDVAAGLGMPGDLQSSIMLRGITLSENLLNFLGGELGGIVQNILDRTTFIMWSSGVQMLVFLGALQSIPESYYEAAHCDGGTEWQNFWKITLPLMFPSIVLVIIFTMTEIFLSTENKVIKQILANVVTTGSISYGSALAWIYFIFILVIFGLFTLFTGRIQRKNE